MSSSEGRSSPSDSVLVSTDWLAAHLQVRGDEHVRIVDVRGQVRPPGTNPRYVAKRAEYDAGHVPGAVFVDWTRDIIDPLDPVPAQVARPEPFAAKMGELGIGDDALVVVYDDYDHVFAGRLAWVLRYYGHDAVRILDGGFGRWVAEGRPISTEVPRPSAAQFTPRLRPALRKTAEDVARMLGDDRILLVDARPAAQYEGSVSAARRAGHIPGARSVPYASLIDEKTSRFRSTEEIAEVFARAGIDVRALPRDIVVYCNGGVTCTVPLNALRLLGRDDVSVYDGSWNEWGNDDARPIVQGRDP